MFLGKHNVFELPQVEEKVLKFWEENKIFEKSLQKNKGKKKFVFFEGPPTANGKPGIHHVFSRSFKDIILRFKTMLGFFVPRKAGWDTHGLPVEIEVEKKLGLKSKKDIEQFGIAAFNEQCKKSVWEYKDEWEKTTKRIGFWLDLKNAYITYKKEYIESLWWILSEVYRKKLLVQDYKVIPWCTRCETALSSHELALGYKTTLDDAVYVKFKLKEESCTYLKTSPNTYILAWTTTPWTLPGNVALAVGEDIEYVLVKKENENYILAKERLSILEGEKYEIIKSFLGKEIAGIKYNPLFEITELDSPNSYKVYLADFVTTTEGTGIVHTAVMYGEDDYKLGEKVGLPRIHTVDEKGRFKNIVKNLANRYVKDEEINKEIFDYLNERGLLFKVEKYEHEYPYCWRCGTPLLYYARHSWFIKMSSLKKKLLKLNETINWIPESIKYGRFGEWLKEVRDWAISRERYWGTPLPIWVCAKCQKEKIIGSIKELTKYIPLSKNKYFLVRHGEAFSNKEAFLSSYPEKKENHLTLKGIAEVKKIASKLRKEKIDIIFSSDILRTKETALTIAKEINVEVVFDHRLREINFGTLNGQKVEKYHLTFPTYEAKFNLRPENGESLNDLRKRLFDFVKEIESKYSHKKILIISHEYPIWLLTSILYGYDYEETIKIKEKADGDFIKTGELIRNLVFKPGPRNAFGEIDLHRPYIDEIAIPCKCGGTMKRASEVVDVWFDSGAMPFAQHHYPFNKKIDYPAHYIVEGVDQTRGWFYTLLAIATLLGYKAPYRNVISLGLVLDKHGQKMSKSKGNVVNPWEMINKYGADVIRWYFYTANAPHEPKKFDENDLQKISRQFFSLIYNSFIFYITYTKNNKLKPQNVKFNSDHILDEWIYVRLLEVAKEITNLLNDYQIVKAAKTLETFVDDLSKWYIRRSRRRFQKPNDQVSYRKAVNTLYIVLYELSKLLAPFTPFLSEALYQSLHYPQKPTPLSVHLEKWQFADRLKLSSKERKVLLEEMEKIREISSAVLRERAENGIKVRQPLLSLTLHSELAKLFKYKRGELLEILKEEVNVKEIKISNKIDKNFILDTTITPALKIEGLLRELVRIIQDLRQDIKMHPTEKIIVAIDTPDNYLKDVIIKNKKFVLKEVNALDIVWKVKDKFDLVSETQLDQTSLTIAIKRLNKNK